MKLGTKVNLAVAAIVVVTILILICVSAFNSRTIIKGTLEEQQITLANNLADQVDAWAKAKLAIIDAGGKELSNHATTEKDYILNQAKLLSAAGGFKKVYAGYEDGTVVMSDGWTIPPDYDARKRPWYVQTKADRKTGFTQPYIASSTGKLTISFMEPLVQNGTFNGVLSSDIQLTEVIEKVLKAKMGTTGYSFIVDKDGKILVHPKEELVMKKTLQEVVPELAGVVAKMATSDNGRAEYNFGGDAKIMTYAKIPVVGWYACMTATKSEMYSPLTRQITSLTTTGAICLALSLTVIVLLVKKLLDPLNAFCIRVADIAAGEGDLTKRLEVGERRDEIGVLARELNLFIEKIQGIILQIAEVSRTLSSESGVLTSTSTSISVGADAVAAQTSTVATASEEMSATASDIANNCHAAAQNAELAAKKTKDGFQVVSNTVEGIRKRGELTRENSQAIATLGERSEQIGIIVGTIEDIADQTNLLALNAAIEAARAGEQGRGFAVVADEVRALAERTTRATKEISDMIRAIQNETRSAMTSMEQGVMESEKGISEAAQIEEALREILNQVESVTGQVNQIATAAEEQTAVTSEITNNIQQVTTVVQETAVGSQRVASSATQLSDLSNNMRAIVGRFKL
jgi:methyl-accepting chemotaxis protein